MALAWTGIVVAAIVAVTFLVLLQRVDPPRDGGPGWEDPAARQAADELGTTVCEAVDAARRIADEHRRAVR